MINSGKEYKGIYPRFEIASTATALPVYKGDYAYGELFRTLTVDEDNKWTEEFADKAGRVVFSRVAKSTTGGDQLGQPPGI
ncbi:MAG: hypothetical protein KL787_04220 [Taibaiella sp.]|nr:hypothetical protein [Taibaiella sp.]